MIYQILRYSAVAIAALQTIMLMGCGGNPLQSSGSMYDEMQSAIETHNYAKAEQTAAFAQKYAESKSKAAALYNEAVVSIYAGRCRHAEELLVQALALSSSDDVHLNESSAAIGCETNSEETHTADAKVHAYAHQAIAIARVCPTDRSNDPKPNDYAFAIDNMYRAALLGLEVRDQMSHLMIEASGRCELLVPKEQKTADLPQNAYEIVSGITKIPPMVLCPGGGLWFKIKVKRYEKLNTSFSMKSLERSYYPDDSMRLPFGKFHVDIYSGNDIQKPISSYIHPLPASLSAIQNEHKLMIELPPTEASDDDTMYIHIYSERFGEAKIEPQIAAQGDCSHTDDRLTYTDDLIQTVSQLNPQTEPQPYLLCPGRPDKFTLDLSSHQYALLSIQSADSIINNKNNFRIDIRSTDGQPVPYIDKDPSELTEKTSGYIILRENAAAQRKAENAHFIYILLYNSKELPEKYTINLTPESYNSPIEYQLGLSASSSCTEDETEQTVPLDLSNLAENGTLSLLPVWICQGKTVSYRPILPDDSPTMQVHIVSSFFSGNKLQNSDYIMNSLLRPENDINEYHVETGAIADHFLQTKYHALSRVLKKPLVKDSLVRTASTSSAAGFSLLSISAGESQDNQDSSDQENQEDKDKNSQKKKKDETKGDDSQNSAPQKPTDSASSPNGPGTDGAGDESTPDETASGDKAAKYDPKQYEKDHIDDLLDAIEQGDYYVPLSGELDEKSLTDKDW